MFYKPGLETNWSVSLLHITGFTVVRFPGGDTTTCIEAWKCENSNEICTLLPVIFQSTCWSAMKYEMWSTNFWTELFIAFGNYLVLSPNVICLCLNAVNPLILPLLETSVETVLNFISVIWFFHECSVIRSFLFGVRTRAFWKRIVTWGYILEIWRMGGQQLHSFGVDIPIQSKQSDWHILWFWS
jgi:hypothetical protein